MTAQEIIDFEKEIADLYNQKKIPHVIHLASGGEEELIRIFKQIRSQDWVLGSWRSHYHCLLKGVPREQLKQSIIDGHSIALCFPEYKILCSGIFGGVLPIAVGLAMSIKRRDEDSMVYCFMGDMTAESGVAHECVKYSQGHELPIQFFVEDNGLSVCTETQKVWGTSLDTHMIDRYSYEPGRFPHAGSGVRVPF